jgi:molybdenum cofactor cytidylyltransferase
MPNDLKFAAVILAAGSSRRMGKPKLLLPWGNQTILEHLIQTWHELKAAQIAIVHSDQPYLLEAFKKISLPHNLIPNTQSELGMFESIRCAARWDSWNHVTHWIISLGDQPHISKETLSQLIDFSKENPEHIVQPEYRDNPRHPVVLPQTFFGELKSSSCKTLKEFLIGHSSSIRLCPIGDAGLELDIDDPSDYEKAIRFTNERSVQQNL